jgi:hypothetical protein
MRHELDPVREDSASHYCRLHYAPLFGQRETVQVWPLILDNSRLVDALAATCCTDGACGEPIDTATSTEAAAGTFPCSNCRQ